jgi:hypothetical protein
MQLVRASRVATFVVFVVAGAAANFAEKIRDTSPDGKFAVCIRYDFEANQKLIESNKAPPGTVFADAVQTIDLIALPGKEPVQHLVGERASGFSLDDIAMVWSPDSRAFALYMAENRVSYLTIEELSNDKFVVVSEPDTLSVDVKDAFTQKVRPVRWIKPGILLLEETATFRNQRPPVTLQLTAAKDPQTGKYKIISQKRVRRPGKSRG